MTDDTNNTEPKVSKHPSFIAYQARKSTSNGKDYYTRIGVTWAHAKDGGHTLDLDAIPLNGRVLLFIPSDKKA